MSEPHRPLFVFRYTLSAADVLAYERLPRELGGREKALLFAVPFAAGLAAGAVLDEWPALPRWAVAGAVALSLAVVLFLVRGVLRRCRARRAAEREGETMVEDWGDHLAVRSGSGHRFLALETIAQVLADRGHVFLRHDRGPTILPLRAFAGAGDMHAYAQALDRRSLDAGA